MPVLRNEAQKTVKHIPDTKVFSPTFNVRSTVHFCQFSRGSPRFHCEWMCERLFLFGGLHVIPLPALCDHLWLSLFQP